MHPVIVALLAIVPAAIVGVAVWFVAGGGDGSGDARLGGNVANVINAFTAGQQGTDVERFEGELPPGFPEELPRYPGSRTVAGVRQITGDDVSYLVVFDTSDSRQQVSNFYEERFGADPWQIELGQASRGSSLHQFSNIEDANIEGVVLAAESKTDRITTIFVSVQVVGGGRDVEGPAFDPGVSRPVPAGFPADQVPQYPDSILIETAYQSQPNARTYLITLVTRDDAEAVLDFYREHFVTNDWSVEEDDPSQVPEGGEAITFTSEDTETSGSVVAGELDDDDSYTRVDVTVRASR